MVVILLIGLGGAIGSIARFLISNWVQRRTHSWFPWGTYVVNGTGSFVIGIVFALADGGPISTDVLTVLGAGVLGGYTTFSSFSVENMKLFHYRMLGPLIHNTVGQVVGGMLLAALGYWAGSVLV
jgi:fluoride exporter